MKHSKETATLLAELTQVYDDVIDTNELKALYIVNHFASPFVAVTRKKDNQKGSMEFTHSPRFYFRFVKDT